MTDRSAEIAKLLMENRSLANEKKRQLIEERLPGCTMAEKQRGVRIAQELLRAEAAECFDEAATLEAIKKRREAARRAQK
jgi:hypothetical protein